MRTRRAIGTGCSRYRPSITSAIKPRGVRCLAASSAICRVVLGRVRCLAASSAICRIVLGLIPRIISDLVPQIIAIASGHAHMAHRVVVRALARSSSLLPGLLLSGQRALATTSLILLARCCFPGVLGSTGEAMSESPAAHKEIICPPEDWLDDRPRSPAARRRRSSHAL
jgi:hypothetical protein